METKSSTGYIPYIVIIVLLVVIYFIYNNTDSYEKENKELITKIITKENVIKYQLSEIKELKVELDSSRGNMLKYKSELHELNIKSIAIKNKYYEILKLVNSYTVTDMQSYFDKRYGSISENNPSSPIR